MSTGNPLPLSHCDRMRRVVFLCCGFARNVAFYGAGWSERAQPPMSDGHPQAAFWRQANGNFFDMAVLDWCKLLVDRDGKQAWRNVVADSARFEAELLARCQMSNADFTELVKKVRHYRNKYVAHLDDEKTYIPFIEEARPSVGFYHRYIVEHEARTGELDGLPSPDDFSKGHNQCLEEAKQIYGLIR